MTPNFTTGADLFGAWLADVASGTPPVRFVLESPFAPLDIRPGRMVLFGGAPGSGKTAALMQIAIDLLQLNPAARLLIANVEMSPTLLLERVASRLAAVPLTSIMNRVTTADELDRVRVAVASLGAVAGRLAFLNPPYSLEHVAAAGTAFDANVLMLDYIQRFAVGDGATSQREQLEAAVSTLRMFCDAGAAVIVAAAVARQKDAGGSSYKGLGLASFRGSSELEFGCDAAYVLNPDTGTVNFQCEKNRFGAVDGILTTFDASVQTFTAAAELSGLDAFDTTPLAPPRRNTKGGQACDD